MVRVVCERRPQSRALEVWIVRQDPPGEGTPSAVTRGVADGKGGLPEGPSRIDDPRDEGPGQVRVPGYGGYGPYRSPLSNGHRSYYSAFNSLRIIWHVSTRGPVHPTRTASLLVWVAYLLSRGAHSHECFRTRQPRSPNRSLCPSTPTTPRKPTSEGPPRPVTAPEWEEVVLHRLSGGPGQRHLQVVVQRDVVEDVKTPRAQVEALHPPRRLQPLVVCGPPSPPLESDPYPSDHPFPFTTPRHEDGLRQGRPESRLCQVVRVVRAPPCQLPEVGVSGPSQKQSVLRDVAQPLPVRCEPFNPPPHPGPPPRPGLEVSEVGRLRP